MTSTPGFISLVVHFYHKGFLKASPGKPAWSTPEIICNVLGIRVPSALNVRVLLGYSNGVRSRIRSQCESTLLLSVVALIPVTVTSTSGKGLSNWSRTSTTNASTVFVPGFGPSVRILSARPLLSVVALVALSVPSPAVTENVTSTPGYSRFDGVRSRIRSQCESTLCTPISCLSVVVLHFHHKRFFKRLTG